MRFIDHRLYKQRNLTASSEAWFSQDQRYRYLIRRIWHNGTVDDEFSPRAMLFVMLNPSTASAFDDDATLRVITGHAKRAGHDELLVANLFALKSTDPRALAGHPDPIGELNDLVLAALPRVFTIVAWGDHPCARKRSEDVVQILSRPLHCLALTKSGAPHHPLRLSKSLNFQPWPS